MRPSGHWRRRLLVRIITSRPKMTSFFISYIPDPNLFNDYSPEPESVTLWRVATAQNSTTDDWSDDDLEMEKEGLDDEGAVLLFVNVVRSFLIDALFFDLDVAEEGRAHYPLLFD